MRVENATNLLRLTFGLIDCRNMLKHDRRLSISPLVDQKFWRFLETENHESHEEGDQSNGPVVRMRRQLGCSPVHEAAFYSPKRKHQISPATVVSRQTTRLSISHEIAGWQWNIFAEVRTARIVWNETISNSACQNYSDGLENGQQRQQEPPVLGNELQAYRCIYRYVASDTKSNARGNLVELWDIRSSIILQSTIYSLPRRPCTYYSHPARGRRRR